MIWRWSEVQPGKKILRKRGACDETYLVSVGANEKKVEGYGGHQVDDEPTLQVMDGYLSRMGHHFIVAIHECRAKIYDDVHYESDVDWNVKESQHLENNKNSAVSKIQGVPVFMVQSIYQVQRLVSTILSSYTFFYLLLHVDSLSCRLFIVELDGKFKCKMNFQTWWKCILISETIILMSLILNYLQQYWLTKWEDIVSLFF